MDAMDAKHNRCAMMSNLPLVDEYTLIVCDLPLFWQLDARGVVALRFPTPTASEAARTFGEALAWGLTSAGARPILWRDDN